MNIIGITNAYSMNQSACVLRDGQLAAWAEEERFTRDKHALRTFAKNAIHYCLTEGGVSMKEVDYIAIGWDVERYTMYCCS